MKLSSGAQWDKLLKSFCSVPQRFNFIFMIMFIVGAN